MKTAKRIKNMGEGRRIGAFTLIGLLVVIAIIARAFPDLMPAQLNLLNSIAADFK